MTATAASTSPASTKGRQQRENVHGSGRAGQAV
jgi:hypothetical protein